MSTEVKHRRGTTAEHATFTGAIAEITVDTTKKTAVVHDGATAGGMPLVRNTASETYLGNAATATDSGTTGSFTITGTGFTTSVTGTAYYVINKNFATLRIPYLTGTSNATTFTLTGLPAAIVPTNSVFCGIFQGVDNGNAIMNVSISISGGASTVTLTVGGGLWTAASTKSLWGTTINYYLL